MLDQNRVESQAEATTTLPKLVPYDPLMLYLVALLFSPIAVGLLGAVNWRRMGKPERFWPLILFSIIIFLIALLAALFLTFKFPANALIISVIFSGVAGFLFAAWVNNRQRAAYQNWLQTFGEPEGSGCLSVLGIGVLAWLIGVVISFIGSPLLITAATTIFSTVVAPQTVKHDSLSVVYPSTWYSVDATDPSNQENCSQVECVITVRAILGGGGLQIVRFADPSLKTTPLGSLDAQIVQMLKDQIVDAGETHLLTINEQDAILRRLKLQTGTEWVLFMRDKNGDMLRLIAFATPDSYGRYDADIENIIQSIQFSEVGI